MAKISVYFNDIASKSNSELWSKSLKRFLFRHEVNFHSPQNLEKLQVQIELDKQTGTEFIFAVGGDGTVNTIVQHLLRSAIKLLVIPTGTANDFATELGLNSNLKKLISIFQHNSYQSVDVIKVNGHHMITNGGIGLSANVAHQINHYRKNIKYFKKLMKHTGSIIYPIVYSNELLTNFKREEINVFSEDFPHLETRVKASMIMINNQPMIGGSFSVAPNTVNSDGKFNVTIFTHRNRYALAKASWGMMMGNYPSDDPELISFETDKVDITILSNHDLFFLGDGEILDSGKSFSVEVIPQGVNVCCFDNTLLYCNSYSLDEVELT